MSKKAVLIVFVALLVAFGATSAMAQPLIDGLTAPNTVYVNPGGLGQSLVYGYYNVRGNIDLFNVVNTNASDGAKVRVVFRAGKTSEEVLDFSVCLSKNDVWEAFLTNNGTTAEICPLPSAVAAETTITAPAIPTTCQVFSIPSDLTANDVEEGYFEILGLSTIPGFDSTATTNPPDVIQSAAACAAWNSSGSEPAMTNALMGNNTIIQLPELGAFSYNAVALANANIISSIQDLGPGSELTLKDVVIGGCAALEPVLEKSSLLAPYDVATALGGETELIVTFPTRKACHSGDNSSTSDLLNLFNCQAPSTGSCVTGTPAYSPQVATTVYDNDEVSENILNFSPFGTSSLPNEVNVLALGSSAIWNSSLAQSFTVNGQLGWVNVSLVSSTFAPNGLPAIAYTTQEFSGKYASYMVPMAYISNQAD